MANLNCRQFYWQLIDTIWFCPTLVYSCEHTEISAHYWEPVISCWQIDIQACLSHAYETDVNLFTDYQQYPLLHHKQTHPQCDLLWSAFSLGNNWDWYNLLLEEILNQPRQCNFYVRRGKGETIRLNSLVFQALLLLLINLPFRQPKATQQKPTRTRLSEDIWDQKLSPGTRRLLLPLSLTPNEKTSHSWTSILALS